ncbi:minor capsid protein [Paenibacillus terrigena]|uniref:minor capsid protein n=1 Tax=Paenibacillus terrigena TaxID=369333 RepID=UPI0028D6AE86|nr:minor capsid protein [Paenibacillus terrigena]
MLSITDITGYLRQAVPFVYVPNEFSATDPDDCAYVRLSGGFRPSEWTSKRKPSIQIVLRTKQASAAEPKANAIYAGLHRKIEFDLGGTRVVSCTADQSTPIFLGKDANGRTMYSLNFTITTI